MRDAEGLCTRLPLCCGFVCPVAVLRQGIFAPCGRKNHMQTVDIADAAAFERTLRRWRIRYWRTIRSRSRFCSSASCGAAFRWPRSWPGLWSASGGVRPPVETLDITLYRDDLSELGDLPEVRPTQFSTPVAERPSSLWTTSSTPAARRAPRWRPSSASAARHASGWP